MARISKKQEAKIDSAQNEADCINSTLESGGKVRITVKGYTLKVYSADVTSDGSLIIETDEGLPTVKPSNILPGGRGIWEQIELEPKK